MSEARARAAGKSFEPTVRVVGSSFLLKFKMADGESKVSVVQRMF